MVDSSYCILKAIQPKSHLFLLKRQIIPIGARETQTRALVYLSKGSKENVLETLTRWIQWNPKPSDSYHRFTTRPLSRIVVRVRLDGCSRLGGPNSIKLLPMFHPLSSLTPKQSLYLVQPFIRSHPSICSLSFLSPFHALSIKLCIATVQDIRVSSQDIFCSPIIHPRPLENRSMVRFVPVVLHRTVPVRSGWDAFRSLEPARTWRNRKDIPTEDKHNASFHMFFFFSKKGFFPDLSLISMSSIDVSSKNGSQESESHRVDPSPPHRDNVGNKKSKKKSKKTKPTKCRRVRARIECLRLRT